MSVIIFRLFYPIKIQPEFSVQNKGLICILSEVTQRLMIEKGNDVTITVDGML